MSEETQIYKRRNVVGDRRIAPPENVEPDVTWEIFEFNEPDKSSTIDAKIIADIFESFDEYDRAELAMNIVSDYEKHTPGSANWLIVKFAKVIREKRDQALSRELREGL